MVPEEGFCVFTTASPEEQAVAFQFIKELVGTDEQRINWAIIANGPPDKAALFDAPEILEAAAGQLDHDPGRDDPLPDQHGERPLEAEPIWRQMFDDVLHNGVSAQDAANTATEAMNAALAASGKQRLFTERLYTPPTAATPTA